MKALLSAALLGVASTFAVAQSAPAKAPPKAPPAAKPAVPSKATVTKRGGQVVPRTLEERINIDDDPAVTLSPADLEVAKKVHVGDIPCELGATVHVTPHRREGFFIVRVGLQRFRMHPVESRTGAIRLEDPVGGAMWLQLLNKSMLMSQKMGRRLADECMSPVQSTVADNLKKNPMPSLLEPLPSAAAGVAAAAAASVPATAPATAASAALAPGVAEPGTAPASAASMQEPPAAPAPATPASR